MKYMKNTVYLVLLFLITISFNISAQVNQNSTLEEVIHAKFLGDGSGEKFNKFILGVIKYPETNKRLGGRIYAQFVIDTIGNITNIEIIKSLRPDYDQALIDALKQSPKWTPATIENRAIPYKMVYPLVFSK